MNRELVELPTFRDDWKRLGLTGEQLRELETELLLNPKAGSVMGGNSVSNCERMKQGLEEAIAYERGELKANTTRLSVEPVRQWSAEEVKQIRLDTGMTQRLFAEVMGVSAKTVEAWEAGRNTPAGPAGRMLGMMRMDPTLPEKMHILYK